MKTVNELTIPRDSFNSYPYILCKLKCKNCNRIQKNKVKIMTEPLLLLPIIETKCICNYCNTEQIMEIIPVDGKVTQDKKTKTRR